MPPPANTTRDHGAKKTSPRRCRECRRSRRARGSHPASRAQVTRPDHEPTRPRAAAAWGAAARHRGTSLPWRLTTTGVTHEYPSLHWLTALVRMTRGRVAKQVPKKHPCFIGIRAAPLTYSRAAMRPAPVLSAACATTPGKPLGHDKHRRSAVTFDVVQDPCTIVEVGQDERQLPAPVLRHGLHSFHVY